MPQNEPIQPLRNLLPPIRTAVDEEKIYRAIREMQRKINELVEAINNANP